MAQVSENRSTLRVSVMNHQEEQEIIKENWMWEMEMHIHSGFPSVLNYLPPHVFFFLFFLEFPTSWLWCKDCLKLICPFLTHKYFFVQHTL